MPEEELSSRVELEKLRPLVFLRGHGCLNAAGEPRDDLTGRFATAACIAFENAEVSPQELAIVQEAIEQCLPRAIAGDAPARFEFALDQALDVSTELLNKEVNEAIVNWIYEWIPFIESDACIEAFLIHFKAVTVQYAVIIGIKLQSEEQST